jgi:hypothetical protein
MPTERNAVTIASPSILGIMRSTTSMAKSLATAARNPSPVMRRDHLMAFQPKFLANKIAHFQVIFDNQNAHQGFLVAKLSLSQNDH